MDSLRAIGKWRKSVKRFEWSNGQDTVLYKTDLRLFSFFYHGTSFSKLRRGFINMVLVGRNFAIEFTIP